MKVIGMTVKDHLATVTALVAVVFIMQWLVQVADEMNHESEGVCLGVFGCARREGCGMLCGNGWKE